MNETTNALAESLMKQPAKERRKLLRLFDKPMVLAEYDLPNGRHVTVTFGLKMPRAAQRASPPTAGEEAPDAE
jgi:hypothetical protein